jgi:hypothetical protein
MHTKSMSKKMRLRRARVRRGRLGRGQAYVTGIEAANNVMRWCGVGQPMSVIPLELEEAQVIALRTAIRATRRIAEANPLNALLPVPLNA